jgi:hypothetical protein
MSSHRRFEAQVIDETPNALISYLNGDHIKHQIPKTQILPGSQIRR